MSLTGVAPSPGGPRVLVIVPTHNHHETLAFSVRSVLEQSVSDIEVVVIGDGVTPEVRSVACELAELDERVRFEDHPKSARHGEELRDRVIRGTTAPLISYNSDDDLWFPDHLESMISIIGDRDLVHPYPILIDPRGNPYMIPSDLRDPDSVAWHLSTRPRNSISLSGVVHTRDSYLRLPHGWRTTPAGRWTDHYMWQQFFEQDWFRGVTAPRATTLKLVAVGRDADGFGPRATETQDWWDRLHSPGFATTWDQMVHDATWKAAVDLNVRSAAHEDENAVLRDRIDHLTSRLDESLAVGGRAREEVERLEGELAVLLADHQRICRELDLTHSTVSWRLTRPLRAVRRGLDRCRRPPSG